jgi:NAD(P)-dependent dehydrogenase (short-subunit alcohol dehydrogenase family)
VKQFRHALVVGGSGMLAECCRKLLQISEQVSVLARDETRIRAIAPDVHPIVCDYRDDKSLVEALAPMTPDLAITWIHRRRPEVRRAVAERIVAGGRLIQVLGSVHADPAQPERLAEMARVAAGLPILYQAVILGFALTANGSRWLTNDEISGGVFAAVKTEAPLCVVGTIAPWGARPGGSN